MTSIAAANHGAAVRASLDFNLQVDANNPHTLKMVGTRRSTRQAATVTPNYDEDNSASSDEAKPTRKTTKATRQKRAREEDADENAEKKRSVLPDLDHSQW